MIAIFVIILIIGAIGAIAFNVWNYRDNHKKKEQPKKLNLGKEYEQSTRPQTVDEKEQTERILKQWKDKHNGIDI